MCRVLDGGPSAAGMGLPYNNSKEFSVWRAGQVLSFEWVRGKKATKNASGPPAPDSCPQVPLEALPH